MRTASCFLALILSVAYSAADEVLLYAPFDGTADAVVLLEARPPEPAAAPGRAREARGDVRNLGSPGLNFTDGIRGRALVVQDDCRYAVPGNFRVQEGTVAVWLRPHWEASSPAPHYLFCLYGKRDLPRSWAVNRWNIAFAGGQCVFTIYSQTEGATFSVSAPIANWKPREWHHVAATWRNVNSGKPDAEMTLFLDGAPAGSLTARQIDVGPVDDVMALGRDQDASPDYADADCDDFFVYGIALSAQTIAEGVRIVKGDEPYERPLSADPHNLPPAPTQRAEASTRRVEGWWNTAWPFRAEVVCEGPASPGNVYWQCPLSLGADLAGLGCAAALDKDSLRVVASTRRVVAHEGQNPLPARFEDGLAEWQAPGATRKFHIYFQAARYLLDKPLVTHRLSPGRLAPPPPPPPPPPPDYATTAFGKPWDFDDGSFCGIDQWGNKPEFVRNKKVANGILSMDVQDDAYFIWGDMWGQVPSVNQKVAIDLEKFPVLEMRVRQSVNQAKWKLYGRPGTSERLLSYDFAVGGSDWQRIRIDLRKDARWRGVLTALRIDPSKHQPAHIEIDWVRLTAVVPARHGRVETIGAPTGVAARVELSVPKTVMTAGATQQIAVTVSDANGKPVAGQPVRVEVAGGSGGLLADAEKQTSLALSHASRRGLTDAAGRLLANYQANRKAAQAADTLVAVAEFTDASARPSPPDGWAGPERDSFRSRVTVATTPGAPHHYRVEPANVAAIKSRDLPLVVSARLVDEFDNPVNQTRKLVWETDDHAQVTPDGDANASWRGDEKKRWVYHVRVKDEQGLTGESAAICLLPSQPRTDPIVLGPNGYFRKGKNGKGWLPLGGFYANWVGLPEGGEEGRRLISFVDATEDQLVHWLDFLARQGVTAMRFMLRAHTPRGMEPMDVIGRVNMPLFAKVLRYMDLARKHDIHFMLVIHEDYTKPAYYDQRALETFCIPYYQGQDLDGLPPHQRRFIRDRKLLDLIDEKYTDPDAMACQDQYTRELLGLLKDNPQLFSWEFENEMVNCPKSWANHMAQVIRSADPVTPICASHGGGGLHTADPLWWCRETSIDFYTYHLYPGPSTTSPDFDYGAAVDVLASYGRMAGACMLGESAGDEFSRYPADRHPDRRYIMRDIIWFSLVNANPGCFFWNARGFEVEQFRLANKIASGLEWSDWLRQRPDIGVVVAHPWDDDKYYRTPEGRADYAMMGRYAQHYLSAGVDFDFAIDELGYAKTARVSAEHVAQPPSAVNVAQPPSAVPAFAPPAASSRLSIPPGWQLRANAREGYREGLAYVRNFAGIRPWQEPKIHMYLRDRKPAPLKIRFDLPFAKIAVTATDLDTGAQNRFEIGGRDEIDLGLSGHDWALLWRAQ